LILGDVVNEYIPSKSLINVFDLIKKNNQQAHQLFEEGMKFYR